MDLQCSLPESVSQSLFRQIGSDSRILYALKGDLSPERRTEAINALATFGAYGYGRQAAKSILEAIKGYSVSSHDNDSPTGQLKQAALSAFGQAFGDLTATIPKDDALPVVLEALKSDSPNQRLFAVSVLPSVSDNEEETAKLLSGMLDDRSAEVRIIGANHIVSVAPATPGLSDVIREFLLSKDPNHAMSGSYMVVGLLRHLGRGGPLQTAAFQVLQELGPAAVPALEQMAKPVASPPTTSFWMFGPTQQELRLQARETLDALPPAAKRKKPDEVK